MGACFAGPFSFTQALRKHLPSVIFLPCADPDTLKCTALNQTWIFERCDSNKKHDTKER
jgi:hypothetical protein